ncbi:MAG TPA: hypothetical protein VKB76_09140 [Ktedonobacterales bacterium]|nr:hypothetical protein [Ktedonobacterales bacterium]
MMDAFVELAFQPPPLTDLDRLAELWQRARTVAETMPACPCHGIVAGVIDPDVMEHNMLAPLRARYRQSGHDELVALLERRLRKSPFAGGRSAFSRWLQGLEATSLSKDARQLLYADIESGLRFYAESAEPFTCT